MTFGEKLKVARQKANLSQKQFSEKLHVSRSAVAKWETEKGMPDIENLKSISQLLSVPVNYLLDDGDAQSLDTIKETIKPDEYKKAKNAVLSMIQPYLTNFQRQSRYTLLSGKRSFQNLSICLNGQ